MSGNVFIYELICAVTQSISIIMSGVCLDRLLTGRDDRASKRKRLVLWGILGSMVVCIKCFAPFPAIYSSTINPILVILVYVLALKCLYSDKVWVKATHAVMLVLQNAMADVITVIVLGEIKNLDMMQSPFVNPYMAERSTKVAMLSVMLNVIYTMIILRMRKKKREKVSPVWITGALQCMLMLACVWAVREARDIDRFFDYYIGFCCILNVLGFSLAALYLSRSEKREKLEEAAGLQETIEQEKAHYQELEARREEMAKLRHDYNNILTSVMFLTKNGKADEAAGVIRELKERIGDAGA